jgi:hypothetical protein
MGPHRDIFLLQKLLGNGPRENVRGGQTPRKMSPAPVILKAAVTDMGGEIGVRGARAAFQKLESPGRVFSFLMTAQSFIPS